MAVVQPNVCADWIQLGPDIDGDFHDNESGRSVALSADGTTVAVGAPYNNGAGPDSGHVRVFRYQANAWVQLGGDINGEAGGDESGWSISVSDDGMRLAVGAPLNDGGGTFGGHVRVFEYQADQWRQVGDDIDGEAWADYSGYSVSLSSDGMRLAIGAPYHDGTDLDSGHVRVFELQAGSWMQLGNDIDGESAYVRSGWSVSLSSGGSRLAIGAPNAKNAEGLETGHVRVFEYQADQWRQLGDDIDGEAEYDKFGHSVSLSADGGRVAIGATLNDGAAGVNSGHVRVLEYQSGVWMQLGDDIDGEASNDTFGYSVSLTASGDRVAIGAPFDDNWQGQDSGHTHVYDYFTGSWQSSGTGINGEDGADWSGWAVSLSADGQRVAIGAPQNDNPNGSDSGHVRVFEKDPEPTATPVPEPTATPDPNCVNIGLYAYEIAFSPDHAVPGDPVRITFPVHNVGFVPVNTMMIGIAYEETPLDPTDDPNPVMIDTEHVYDLAAGESETLQILWDTTGLQSLTYPVYVFISESHPPECSGSTFVSTDFILPVELLSFTARGSHSSVDLEWITVTEINNFGFNILRSTHWSDGFVPVNDRIIPGAGTSFQRREYSWTDSGVQNGVPVFYRLEIVDGFGERTETCTVAAVPHSAATDTRTGIRALRKLYSPNDTLILTGYLKNGETPADVRIQVALLINGVYAGDIVSPQIMKIPAGLDSTFMFSNHCWTGTEPEGTYVIGTILEDQSSGELLHVDVSEFVFCRPTSPSSMK